MSELRYFVEVNHRDHEALVALDPDTGEGIGVARYVRSHEDPSVAELAVAVVDDWQGLGVGSRLVSELADRARDEGVTSFSATVLAENDTMLKLLEELGRMRVIQRELGTVELTVDLKEGGLARLRRLMRSVAAGQLTPFLRAGQSPR